MRRSVLGPGLLTGVGLAMTLDEIVFHQLLGWHHLVQEAPLTSDGVLHIAGTTALVVGAVLLVLRRPLRPRPVGGAVLTGAGGFNVFDGTVNHKLLDLHQVRENVQDTTVYDVTWIGLSAVVLAIGLLLLQAERGAARQRAAARAGR